MSVLGRMSDKVRSNRALPDWMGEPETIWLVFALGFIVGAVIL